MIHQQHPGRRGRKHQFRDYTSGTEISPSLAVTQTYHRFPCRPRSSYLSAVFGGNSDTFMVMRMVIT